MSAVDHVGHRADLAATAYAGRNTAARGLRGDVLDKIGHRNPADWTDAAGRLDRSTIAASAVLDGTSIPGRPMAFSVGSQRGLSDAAFCFFHSHAVAIASADAGSHVAADTGLDSFRCFCCARAACSSDWHGVEVVGHRRFADQCWPVVDDSGCRRIWDAPLTDHGPLTARPAFRFERLWLSFHYLC
jgi:hypothetical protein